MILQICMCLVVIILVIREKIQTKYAIFWLFSSFFMAGIELLPASFLEDIAEFLGFDSQASMLYSIVLVCHSVIMFLLTIAISNLDMNVRRLARALALLDKRLRDHQENEENEAKDE